MKKIELLAPARDLECAIAAVNCGADAVYIGAERFGARAAAGNSLSDIARLSAYSARYKVKVYAALNTLLTAKEMPAARKLAFKLWEAGVSALIIQDVGLLEGELPPIPLIASTQTHNSSPEKALFLEKAGFKRIILARELTLEEIKKIREKTSIELEFFVHGALCVSYSGQCYMSFAIGGRSGNRGECAQPCRKTYKLKDSSGRTILSGKHPLCLKDLNLSRRLEDLIDAGITSFKIEGRLKDSDYVKNTVSFYRRELDKIIARKGLAKSSLGRSYTGFEPDLSKTFNRGYTEYFIGSAEDDPSSPDSPKFIGEKIGIAQNVKSGSFELKGTTQLRQGDGITYFDKNGRLTGNLVNGIKDGIVYADKLSGLNNGALIYRNMDSAFIKSLRSQDCHRKLGVQLELRETETGFSLMAISESGVSIEIHKAMAKKQALKKEKANKAITDALSRLGESIYYLEKFSNKLSEPYFIPLSILNEMRREAVSELEKKEGKFERENVKIKPNSFPYPEKELDFRGNVLNPDAEKFYRRHGIEKISAAAEGGGDISGKPLMISRFCVRKKFIGCKKGKAEPLFLEDSQGHLFRLEFDCEKCLMKLYLEKTLK